MKGKSSNPKGGQFVKGGGREEAGQREEREKKERAKKEEKRSKQRERRNNPEYKKKRAKRYKEMAAAAKLKAEQEADPATKEKLLEYVKKAEARSRTFERGEQRLRGEGRGRGAEESERFIEKTSREAEGGDGYEKRDRKAVDKAHENRAQRKAEEDETESRGERRERENKEHAEDTRNGKEYKKAIETLDQLEKEYPGSKKTYDKLREELERSVDEGEYGDDGKAAIEKINHRVSQVKQMREPMTPMTGEKMAQARGRDKADPKRVYRHVVDDYEHSGDTEADADRLEKYGARIQGTSDINDYGEDEGSVTYKLPPGISPNTFSRALDAGDTADNMRHDSKKGPEAKRLDKLLTYEMRNGNAEQAMLIADRIERLDKAPEWHGASAGLKDTEMKYKDSTGKWDKKRVSEVHDAYTKDALEGVPKSKSDKPIVYMTGGGPASGKTSALLENPELGIPPSPKNDKVKGGHRAAHVNADEAKEFVPEYKAGKAAKDLGAAAFAHEESSHMSKLAAKAVLGAGSDLVFDSVGDSGIEKMEKKVAEYRQLSGGGRVIAHYATIDVNEAIRRSDERAKKSGREVPHKYIREAHKDVSQTLQEAAKRGTFDEFTLHDNSQPFGQKPKKVASYTKENGLVIHNQEEWDKFVARGNATIPEDKK